MAGVSGVVSFGRTVVSRAREENVTFMAGSIAYQAFTSLAPLLVLAVFFVSLIAGERLADRVVALTGTLVAPTATPVVRAIIETQPAVGASVVGLITLVWGSFRLFHGLDTAFSEIYDTQSASSLRDHVEDVVVVAVALFGAVFAAVLATAAFAALDVPHLGLVAPFLLIGGLVPAFYPMYRRFPDADVSLRETLPGVLVAATGWAGIQAVFQVYVAFAGRATTASVIGAVLFLLTWLYLGSLVLLVAAVVNATVANRG